MVITAETLERLGIHERPDQIEQLVLEAMEQMLAGWRVVSARDDLTPAEVEALARGGLILDQANLGLDDPLVRSSAEYGAMLATGLTVARVAEMLGLDGSRIRQRLAARTLYGVKLRGGWRIPLFQFEGGHLLPGIEQVLPRLRADVHPLSILHWFTTPNADLPLGAEETAISPRDWLRLRLDPAQVAALAAEL